MSKKNLSIILGVILVLALLLILKGIFNPVEKQVSTLDKIDLQYEWNRIANTQIPSVIIFSYDADCCESTKAFFDKYNTQVLRLAEHYKGRFNVLFINLGLLEKKHEDLLIHIAETNNVSRMPSILLLDNNGKTYKVIEGIFDVNKVRKILDGMVE